MAPVGSKIVIEPESVDALATRLTRCPAVPVNVSDAFAPGRGIVVVVGPPPIVNEPVTVAGPREQVGQQHLRAALERRDPDRPRRSAEELRRRLLRPHERHGDVLRRRDERVPGGREPEPAPVPLGQRHARAPRQALELLRDGRRRAPEHPRRRDDAAPVRDHAQGLQLPDVHEATLHGRFTIIRWT